MGSYAKEPISVSFPSELVRKSKMKKPTEQEIAGSLLLLGFFILFLKLAVLLTLSLPLVTIRHGGKDGWAARAKLEIKEKPPN